MTTFKYGDILVKGKEKRKVLEHLIAQYGNNTLAELLRALPSQHLRHASLGDNYISFVDIRTDTLLQIPLTQPLTGIPEDHECWEKLVEVLNLK